MRTFLVGLMGLGCGLSVVACSDDGNSGGSGGSTYGGVSLSKKLGDFTASDAKGVCQASESKQLSAAAEFGACARVMAVMSPTECQAACSEPSEPDPTDEPCDDAEMQQSVTELAGCEATLGELIACMDASFAESESFYSTVTCENATTKTPPTELPSACGAVESKCPTLFEMD